MAHIAKVLMVQGTSSSAGKSFLVTGLCRLFSQEGFRVAPFKAQNMSNNSFVTLDGHEIGRAQAVQAKAARVLPHVDMNPILLKPEADHRSQVIVMGTRYATLSAGAYEETKKHIWEQVTGALERLRSEYDLVLIEGAGSPAEINLKDRDIVNMKVALHANAPVLIVGDIDRGGVFAHFFGTHQLLAPEERALVKGLMINRFRGDASLLDSGLVEIEHLTGVPVLGTVPWVHDHGIPEEDGVAIESRTAWLGSAGATIDVAILKLPRIANFDDFDPLESEADVTVRYVEDPSTFGNPDIVILPGTKSTIADLQWVRYRGLDKSILQAAKRGAAVIGICGGYQMLGGRLQDEDLVEASAQTATGFGLFDAETRFDAEKITRQTRGTFASNDGLLSGLLGECVDGYEIHAGRTASNATVAMMNEGGTLGSITDNGWTFGCYLHGLFHATGVRRQLLSNVAERRGKMYEPSLARDEDQSFDRLATVLRSWLDIPAILEMPR